MSTSTAASPTNSIRKSDSKLFRQSGIFSEGRKRVFSFLQVIDNAEAKSLFLAYLKRCKNEDSLLFIEEVHKFLTLSSPSNRYNVASYIMAQFIEFESCHELNISVDMRKNLITEFSKCDRFHCPKDLFDRVYNQMLIQLQLDSFPRFQETEDFYKWASKMKKECENFEDQFMELADLYESPVFKSYSSQLKITERRETVDSSEYDRPSVSIYFKAEDLEYLKNYSSQQLIQLVQDMMDVEKGIVISKVKQPTLFDKLKVKKQLFSGEDLIKWLQQYLQKEDKAEMVQIAEVLLKYDVLGVEKKGADVSSHTLFFKLKKKLVLLGIGFANAFIAKELEDDFDVTMVDSDPNWEYNISYHMLFGDPNKIKNISLPMYRISKKATFVLGTAEFITPKVVAMKNPDANSNSPIGKIIPYDYLIVATGSSYKHPFPIEIDESFAKKPSIIMPYSSSSILSQLKALQEATKVVVIGTGPVAMECGLEIVHHYKKAQVTFVTQSNSFLERAAPMCHKYIYKYVSTLPNVNVQFNRRVVGIKNNRIQTTLNDVRHDTGVVDELEADVVLLCVGFKPNTECFVPYFSGSMDELGYAIINDKFQLVKHTQDYTSALTQPSPANALDTATDTSSDDDTFSDAIEREDGDLEQSDWPVLLDIFKPNSGESSLAKRNNSSTFYNNIFAAGDIISSKEEKLGYIARFHANFIINYLTNYEVLRKPVEEVNAYSYAPLEVVRQAMSLGPKNGITFKENKIAFKGKIVNLSKNAFESSVIKTLKG